MDAVRAATVIQSVSRGHVTRWRMKSPFFKAAVRAGWLWRHVPPKHGIAKRARGASTDGHARAKFKAASVEGRVE